MSFGNLFWYKPTTRRLVNNFYGNLRGYRAPRKGEICSARQTRKALPSNNFQLINFFFCSARGLFSYFTVSCYEATTRFSSSSLCRRRRTPPPHAAVVASSSPSAAAARHRCHPGVVRFLYFLNFFFRQGRPKDGGTALRVASATYGDGFARELCEAGVGSQWRSRTRRELVAVVGEVSQR